MPRKKKKPHEMTTDELARKVFPKEVIEEIRRVASEPKRTGEKKEERSSRS